MAVGIDVGVLGTVEVRVDGEARAVGGRRQRAVLACLVLERRRTVSVDALIERLWDDAPPRTARNSVQRFIADLRRVFDPHGSRLRTVPDGYCLWLGEAECDLGRVQEAIAAADRARDAGAHEIARIHYEEALEQWRGPALSGIGDALHATAAAARLEDLRTAVIESIADVGLRVGCTPELLDRLRALVVAHPTRQRASALLAHGLHQSGRSADALAELTRLRSRMRDELGLDPSPEIGDLEHRIIVQDATLEPVPADRSLPAQLQRSLEHPIVGRTAELAHAAEVVERVVAGGSGLLLYSGEPGIGKTRLVAEIARSAADRGVVVRYGRSEREVRGGYQVWAEALAGGLDDEAWESGTSQIELFRRVVQHLTRCAEVAPQAVVLDDLHWSDRSSIELLVHVLRRMPRGVLLIGAHRDAELDAAPLLAELAATAAEELRVAPHRLAGLPPEDVASLVGRIARDDAGSASPSLVDAVLSETDGNPFFATEIARHLVRQREFGDEAVDASSLPSTVRAIVASRVTQLGPDAADALRTASAFGREFEIAVLARVLDRPEEQVVDLVEHAESAALVAPAPTGDRRIAFSHDLVHHALYQELGAPRRSRLHRSIADAMEAEAALDGDARIEVIAHHLIAAHDPRLATRTIAAARRAAAQAAQRHAPAEAVELLRIAVHECGHLPVPDDALRAGLLVELGIQQRRSGDPDHRTTLHEAARTAKAAGEHEILVAAAVANTGAVHSHVFEIDADEIALLEDALAVVGGGQRRERAVLLAALANERWAPEDRELVRRLRDESLQLAREVDDPATLVDVLIRATRSRKDPPPVADVAALNEEARAVSRRYQITDPLLELNRLRSEQQHAIQVADADRHAVLVAEIRRHADRFPLPSCVQSALLAEATEAGIAGDVERYEALAEQALEVGIACGDPEAWLIYEAQLFYARMVAGRVEELVEALDRIVEERPDVTIYRAVLAWVLAELGRRDDAASLVDEQHRLGFAYFPNMIDVQELMLWAEGAVGAGHVAAAATLAELLAPHSGEFGGHLNQVTQPLDLTIARALGVVGDHGRACVHLDRAMAIAERFDAPWMRARTDLSRAELLAAVDATGAAALARSVRDVATRSGFAALAVAADRLVGD